MAGIGNLVVNLKANASQFNKEMASAKTSVKGFHGIAVPSFKSIASAATSMLNPIKVAMTALAAGAVSAGVAVYGLTSRMGEIAGLSDKAAQFGVSVKFLQQLEFAADQSGVSAETLSKSIGKLTIAVGNAASGSKPAQEAFARLGLDYQRLQTLAPEQQFMEVAKAISALPSQTDRASASVALFGKTGLEMTTLFAGGMNNITELMREADSLGIGLNEEDVARVAAADDALQKMKASFGALVDQAIVGLAPTFEAIATTIKEWIAPLTKFLDGFNALNDKAKWIQDVFQTSMDVAFQHIMVRWNETIDKMWNAAKDLGGKLMILATGNPFAIGKVIGETIGNSAQQNFDEQNLRAAEARLSGLLAMTAAAAANQNERDMSMQAQRIAEQLAAQQAAKVASQPNLFQQAMPWLSLAKDVGLNLAGKTVGGIASVQAAKAEPATPIEYKSVQPAFATAANRGSSEAFKTILRSQRPEVKAMNTIANAANRQVTLQQQLVRNTAPQFAPEF